MVVAGVGTGDVVAAASQGMAAAQEEREGAVAESKKELSPSIT